MLEHKDAILEAIDELIAHYNQFEPEATPESLADDCPLCDAARDRCHSCPWIIFEGYSCVVNRFDRDTTAQRLERLERWRAKIKETKPC